MWWRWRRWSNGPKLEIALAVLGALDSVSGLLKELEGGRAAAGTPSGHCRGLWRVLGPKGPLVPEPVVVDDFGGDRGNWGFDRMTSSRPQDLVKEGRCRDVPGSAHPGLVVLAIGLVLVVADVANVLVLAQPGVELGVLVALAAAEAGDVTAVVTSGGAVTGQLVDGRERLVLDNDFWATALLHLVHIRTALVDNWTSLRGLDPGGFLRVRVVV